VGVLAQILEAAGIATVALASVLGQARRMRAPRALYCEFPLGRPLGRPLDPGYQHRVLAAAFALLATPAEAIPVLVEFPDVIVAEADEALACPLPPRFDAEVPAAVDEARGLVAAQRRTFERTGRTSLGKVLTPEQVPEALGAFLAVADGRPWNEVGIPGDPISCAADIRAFYEEAALSLVDHVPAARQAEGWYVEHTEAGRVMQRAQAAMKAAGAPHPLWFYLLPMSRHGHLEANDGTG
jgi:hypothetical protein